VETEIQKKADSEKTAKIEQLAIVLEERAAEEQVRTKTNIGTCQQKMSVPLETASC